ncbi:MAG: hypothetical protein ACOX6I_07015 [Syntrophomonadaceae bacterium]
MNTDLFSTRVFIEVLIYGCGYRAWGLAGRFSEKPGMAITNHRSMP